MLRGSDELQDHGNKQEQESPEVGEDPADVVAAAAKHGEEGVAEIAFQKAAREPVIGFHVADLGLDADASSEGFRECGSGCGGRR